MPFSVGLLCVSDTAAALPQSDRSLPTLRALLPRDAYTVVADKIVADESPELAETVRAWVHMGIDLVLTSGGTGMGSRDSTPEAIAPLIDRPAPGLIVAMLTSSLAITPLAALSRPVAGIAHSPAGDGTGTLIVTLPGSPKAAKENLECLLRVLPHALELAGGKRSRSTMVHQRLERGEDGLEGVKDAVREQAQHQHQHHHHHHHHHHLGHEGHAAPRARTLLSQDPSIAVAERQRKSPWPLISVREALALIFEHTPVTPVQTVSASPSLIGHVLAEDVHAPGHIPAGPSTNIDGYAVAAASTPAGEYDVVTAFPEGPMPQGTVYRINTGAPLPPGTDACIMVEDTEVAARDAETGDETRVRLLAQVAVGENVRAAGSDVRAGDRVLERGDVVGRVGGELGTLAFVGQRSVRAHRRPIVAVLSTGNELRDLQDTGAARGNEAARIAGIVDSNRPTLLGVLQSLHFVTIDLGICGDSMADTKARLKKGAEEADIVITTGGTSMGVGDLLKPCIERELGGTVHFGRVAMKPGKPTTFATLPAHPMAPSRDPTLVFALPGNPASALVTFYLFVLPALRKLEGRRAGEWELPRVPVSLTVTVPLDPRPEYHRVLVRPSAGTGTLQAFSTGGQRSSRTVSLAGANGLLELPAASEGEGREKRQGEMVQCVLIGEMGSAL